MKKFLLKIREFLFVRHPAGLVVAGLAVLLYFLLDARQIKIEPDLALAERYLEVAEYYQDHQNLPRAQQAVHKALELSRQPLIQQSEQLGHALYLHARLIQANPDSTREAIQEFLQAGTIIPTLQDSSAARILRLLKNAFAVCRNSEKAKGLQFFAEINHIDSLKTAQIKTRFNAEPAEWARVFDYFCIR